ncbi:hypothetical protein BMW23_0989 [Bodo saltans virus]|uniref:Uncharacterized protein n=1 Tax=Bodo saltans virus TaxID=2024608 RepID=A0A2H4UVW9_9VIRU|nr:hypothetical protein QJ851_gp0971 [Bodo saltans virus]ATZ81034.1 hypothetical protein BMW23_0989 [Bodo saltans virus]
MQTEEEHARRNLQLVNDAKEEQRRKNELMYERKKNEGLAKNQTLFEQIFSENRRRFEMKLEMHRHFLANK